MINTYTRELTPPQAERLRACLLERGFTEEEKPYAIFSAKKPGVQVTVYEKGPKVLIQGKGTEDLVKFLIEPDILEVAEMGYEEALHPEWFEPHLGIDESGKGDVFGPLVIAGVGAGDRAVRELIKAGVTDSKKIGSDAKINALADVIKQCPGVSFEIISINPEKYNQLYPQFGNLNRLLAWGHAQVIENLLEKDPQWKTAISDQFANPLVLKKALKTKGKGIELIQRTKAESDPIVAAASILARHKFISWLKAVSEKLDLEIPKGASSKTIDIGKRFIELKGKDELHKLAKMHFKTVNALIQ